MSKTKSKKLRYDPDEEALLERQVFGDAKDVIDNLFKKNSKTKYDDRFKESSDSEDESDKSSIDIGSNNDGVKDDQEEKATSDIESDVEVEEEHQDEDEIQDAWHDETDKKYTVKEALKLQNRKLPRGRPEKNYKELLENKFKAVVGTPKWAKIECKDTEEEGNDEDEILRHSNHLATKKSKKLPSQIIDIKVLRNINVNSYNEGPIITSVQFHPTSTVALVAGLSGILSICQVDGRENSKLQSIKLENFRINTAKFLRDGTEIFAGSRTKSYGQSYDLMTGKTYKIPLPHTMSNLQDFDVSPDGKTMAVIGRKWGEIFLLTSSGKELIHTFKMHKKCRALAFTPDNKYLITHGESEEMYIWDLNDRRCVHRAIDDGCLAGGAIAVSPSGQFLASGSKQGAVNVYETKSVFNNRTPKPSRIILNLVTPITALKFNPSSEILAMSSYLSNNAFRMVHFPSLNVFSNFPTFGTVMNLPYAIDFSPHSGFMGVTNDKNKAFLYRLKHYGNY